MGLFDKKTKSINGEGFGKEARDRVNAALNGFKLEQDGDLLLQQPLPEDVFFEKSVEPAVPIHYACGSTLRRGFHHHTFRRCGPSWPHSSSESSSALSAACYSTSSMSPEFQQPVRQPFQRQRQSKRPFRVPNGNASRTSLQNSCTSGFPHHHHHVQQRDYDDITPQSSLQESAIAPFSAHQDPVEKFHDRRDSGIGMIEQTPSFTNPFSTTPPSCAAAAVTETTICSHGHLISPINQQHEQHQEEFPLHQQHTSLPNGLHRTSTHNRHISRVALPNLLIHNSINTPYSPPKSPPAPPVLNLGSIDFFSSSTTTDAANPHLDRFGTANNRPPTPIHELRDFFYERSAETGEQTPVFYGTGGNNVSRGWRAKMGAEW